MTRIEIVVEEAGWRKMRGLTARLKQAAALALRRGGKTRKGALTILLSGDKQVRALNAEFRGKDRATNVLSFPAARNDENYLGDIALAFGITGAEAKDSGKRFASHATHLVVHGVLHLLGYDHESAREARLMEPLETKILAELGIADPYAPQAQSGEACNGSPENCAPDKKARTKTRFEEARFRSGRAKAA